MPQRICRSSGSLSRKAVLVGVEPISDLKEHVLGELVPIREVLIEVDFRRVLGKTLRISSDLDAALLSTTLLGYVRFLLVHGMPFSKVSHYSSRQDWDQSSAGASMLPTTIPVTRACAT